MRAMRFVLLVLAAVGSACATTHVTMPEAPAATAPLAARDAYYEDHKSLGIAGQPSNLGGEGLGWANNARFPALQLADGTLVAEPTDLLPAVGAETTAGKAARAAVDARLFANAIYTASLVGSMLGLSGIVVGELALVPVAGGGDVTLAAGGLLGGLALSIVSLVGVGYAVDLDQEAEGKKMSAFLLYDRDLRRHLDLKRPDEVLPLEKKWATPGATPPPALATPPITPPLVDPAAP